MAAVPRFTCIYCPERHISGVHHRLNFSLRRTKHDEHALFRLLISLSQTRSTLRPYTGSDNALEDRHRLIRVSYRRKCSVHPSRLPGNELQAHLNSDCATRLQRQEQVTVRSYAAARRSSSASLSRRTAPARRVVLRNLICCSYWSQVFANRIRSVYSHRVQHSLYVSESIQLLLRYFWMCSQLDYCILGMMVAR